MTLVCQTCGLAFSDYPIIDGKRRHLHSRRQCLECLPFKPRRSPRFQTPRPPRMLVCEDCGYDVSVAALEFHHRDSKTKDFGVGDFSGSWERLVAEAAKCDLLCANCHRRRHNYGGSIAARGKKARAIELMGARCGGCLTVVPDSLFEFHHWDAHEKKFGISRDGMSRPWEAIAEELLKCV